MKNKMETDLIREIQKLKLSPISQIVKERMHEFQQAAKSNADIFSELCFCILTANYTAEGGIRIQKALGSKFHKLTEKQLASRLRSLGHRFPNMRAKFIFLARQHIGVIGSKLKVCSAMEIRQWLAENVLGLGYKEASHFLRNIGMTDLAIIDFHIIDILARNRIIQKPKSDFSKGAPIRKIPAMSRPTLRSKTLTKKRYLEIESVLRKLANKTRLSLAELDLYLWYMETGKVLK